MNRPAGFIQIKRLSRPTPEFYGFQNFGRSIIFTALCRARNTSLQSIGSFSLPQAGQGVLQKSKWPDMRKDVSTGRYASDLRPIRSTAPPRPAFVAGSPMAAGKWPAMCSDARLNQYLTSGEAPGKPGNRIGSAN